ncbi:MAG TPA: hypothetical protein VGC65_09815 [Bacteroidia bacterium]|jgi:hypothetical protein
MSEIINKLKTFNLAECIYLQTIILRITVILALVCFFLFCLDEMNGIGAGTTIFLP